jgi:hypothetical protein
VACELDCDDRLIRTTVEGLDLGPRAISFVWRQDGGDTVGVDANWTLQVDPISRPKATVLSVGFGDGACGYIYPLSPTTIGLGAFWIAAGSPCDQTITDFALSDRASHRHQVAHIPGRHAYSATLDHGTVYWLRAAHPSGTAYPSPYACVRPAVACQIVASRALPWRPVPLRQPLGPVPNES